MDTKSELSTCSRLMVGERDRDREAVRWATGESTPLQTNNGVLQMVGQLQGGQAAGQQQQQQQATQQQQHSKQHQQQLQLKQQQQQQQATATAAAATGHPVSAT